MEATTMAGKTDVDAEKVLRSLEMIPLAKVGLRKATAWDGNRTSPGRWISDGYTVIDSEAFSLSVEKLPALRSADYYSTAKGIQQESAAQFVKDNQEALDSHGTNGQIIMTYEVLGARIAPPDADRWDQRSCPRIAYIVPAVGEPGGADAPCMVIQADKLKLIQQYLDYDRITTMPVPGKDIRQAVFLKGYRIVAIALAFLVDYALVSVDVPLAREAVAQVIRDDRRDREASRRPKQRLCDCCARRLTD